MRCVFILFCCYVFVHPSIAQDGQSILTRLDARQVNNTVQVSFTIEAGTSYCLGVLLERSRDGLAFESVGYLPGVCGGSEFEESYTMVDDQLSENGTVYYRLDLGNVGKSDILELDFFRLENSVLVFPNPAERWVQVRFNNLENQSFEFRLISMLGSTVMHFSQNSGYHIVLDVSGLGAGFYHALIHFEDDSMLRSDLVIR